MSSNRLITSVAMTMAFSLAVFAVFTFRGFSKTLIGPEGNFVDPKLFEIAEIARENKLELDMYIGPEIMPWDPTNWVMFWWYSRRHITPMEPEAEIVFGERGVLVIGDRDSLSVRAPDGWNSILIGNAKMFWPTNDSPVHTGATQ